MGLEEWEKAPAIGGEAATRAAGVGPMHWCWEIPAPLCTTCFLAFRDGKEAPWWPNARDRLQLVLPHVTLHFGWAGIDFAFTLHFGWAGLSFAPAGGIVTHWCCRWRICVYSIQ